MWLIPNAPPIGFVLTGLLTVGWLLLWRASRRARLWFLLGATVAVLLCAPVAAVVGVLGTKLVCPANHPECSGKPAIEVLVNGLVAIQVLVVLGLITLVVEAFQTARRQRTTQQNRSR